jgi:hypothetical protein
MKRLLLTLLLCLSPAWSYAALVTHLPLNETTGTTATALTGSNGTYARDSSNTTTAGPGGSITLGQDFDGTSDAIAVSWSSTNTISVACWVHLDAAGNFPMFVTRGQTTTNGSVGIELRGNSTTGIPEFVVDTANQTLVVAQGDASIVGGWHHLMGAYDGSTVRLYVDGQQKDSELGTGNITWGTPNAFIGRRAPSASFFANAKFADVRIYDTDEAANVATIMAEGVDEETAIPAIVNHYQRMRNR